MLNYNDFIDICTKKNLLIQYEEFNSDDKLYCLWADDNNNRYECEITDSDNPSDITDFDTNYKNTSNKPIIDDIGKITIKEESVKTGGHYQARGYRFDIPASSGEHNNDFSFPIPVSILSAEWVNMESFDGDEVEFQIAPDTIIGTITSGISIDDTEIFVSSSVIANTHVGYNITINNENFGRVINIDSDNSKITVENSATETHSVNSYVKQTVTMAKIPLVGQGRHDIGESKIGASYIPANTVLCLKYTNNNSTAKTFSFIMEYLY